MQQQGSGQRERAGDAGPQQAQQQDLRRPLDAIPQEGPDGMLPSDRQAKAEILGSCGIDGAQRTAGAAIEKLQAAGIVESGYTQNERSSPQKEIDNVSEAASQTWDGLEKHREARREKHAGQCEKDE